MICSVGQLADQKVSKPTWLSSWICIKVWQLKRTSQQGEIELPPELAKLKSESDFWRLFRVSCHARWGLSGTRLFSRVTYLHFFCSNFVGLFDAEGQSHNTVYALHRFMLCIYCMTVSRSCKGKRVLPDPWHERLRNTHKQFAEKETGY